MERVKYTSYRIFITRRIAGGSGYFALTDIAMYDAPDGQGQNILTGGTASASSIFGNGFEPEKAFDGNPETRWGSVSSRGPEWIQYDLPEPRLAESLYLILNISPENGPADFVVQGSNDGGVNWSDIFSFTDFANIAQMSVGVVADLAAYGLGGIAMTDNGAPANTVLVYDWVNGDLVSKIPVGANGAWNVPVQYSENTYMVVVQGPAGTRPQVHGPVTAEAYQ